MIRYRWTRVDDRLLHGQVALGWRDALDPKSFLIVDDAVAADSFGRLLFEAALPEGTALFVLDTDSFLRMDPPEGCDPTRTILLIRGLTQLRRLCDGGYLPREVNLGGLHHRRGARRYLDYLFMTDDDRAAAESILARGVVLFAQDLPSSSRRELQDLLAHGGDEA
jgi:mannose/fructose/N-acetylgalactosamine-specific phosphotransferase system component IIB